MIPVTYNASKDVWVKADTSKSWYNYNMQKWANAVTVTSTNRNTYLSADPGTEIPMSDINSMWVWIPRFKYKIPGNLGSTSAVLYPPQIEVEFIKKDDNNGISESQYRSNLNSSNVSSGFYIHPSFRNGTINNNGTPYDIGGWDEELSGYWVGKFETSGTTSAPLIKPNQVAIANTSVSNLYMTSLRFAGGTLNKSTGEVIFNGNTTYGLIGTTDTHMAKNTEWGAVAILSQSKYGKMGNYNFTPQNKEIYINNNNSGYTGGSFGSPSGTGAIYSPYNYNNKGCSSVTSCTGYVTSNAGTGASTTGTIYGIYDMNGGYDEYVMGNASNYSGMSSSYNSGFCGTNGSSNCYSFPNRKYYDLYNVSDSTYTTSLERVLLGDATWETLRWYSDIYSFVGTTYPWFRRGGSYSSSTSSGIFAFSQWDGRPVTNISFRSVLIP